MLGALRAAARLERGDRRLVAEAVVALAAARLLQAGLPFRILARRLGGLVAPDAPPPPRPPLSVAEVEAVRAVRWAIRATSPRMPFRAVCLQQAIAARTMLARRGVASVLHLGVGDPTGAKLEAHAWLDAGGIEVTGYPVDPALAEAGRFV